MLIFKKNEAKMSDLDFSKMNEMILAEESRPAPTTVEEAVELIKKSIDITFLVEQSATLAIQTLEDARSAVEMANQSRKIKNRLEETKSGILRPHIDFQRAINKVVHEVEAELNKIYDNLKKKTQVYVTSQDSAVKDLFRHIETDEGSMTLKKSWDYNVLDESIIPSKYMMPNCKEIERAIHQGIREIQGIEIFEKEEISFRVKNDKS